MAPNSFTAANFYLYDTVLGKTVPTTTTVSTDGTTATLTPLSPLLVNRQYYYLVDNVRGVTGNTAGESYWYFTTQSTTSALLPIVTVVNPSNTLTNVPTNTLRIRSVGLPSLPTAAARFRRLRRLTPLTPSCL
jgi:hypothetical protein